ncbi:hypothetical protein, conserved [Leishmania tarentolae]|uniref:Uncharacterized protein n=1 Tax=Leishmania tarentolae TaxID=5689 RepID=A0A640KEL6_LEITA|nr:hypothetical protein, conserved [Leishmania tarentolae]
MDGVDAALHRSSARQPSSPIEFNADSLYARHFTGGASMNGSSNLSVNVSRLMTSPRPPAPPHAATPSMAVVEEPALHNAVNAHAGIISGIAPEEGELDQFDIVLQQDAAASSGNTQAPFCNRSPSNTGTHSPSGATPPLAVGGYAASAGSSGLVIPSTAHYSGGAGSNQHCSPSVLFQGAARRLPSVAGACQASAITQDKDQCARLIHQMASACRGELHLHGYSGSAGGSNTSLASPGGDPRAASSPAAQQPSTASAAAVVSGLDSHIFEEELSLLTGIILEANMAHNPQWQPQFAHRSNHHSSSNSNGGYVSPPHGMLRASPRSCGGVQSLATAPAAAAATTATNLLGASTGVPARSHSRGSPAGLVPGAHLASNYLTSFTTSNTNNDGRSTIDTEVSDSLCRISHLGGGAGSNYHMYMMEHSVRPMNPCQGAATQSGVIGGSVRSISQLQQHQQAWTALMHESVSNPGHLDRAAIASLTGQASRRPSGSAARSTSATVKHPRAVKPEVSSDGGRIRGPRSRTGKNVAPSNHSAFSECSGGETRSCRSTLTGANRVLSSSANATTNTSLSSSVFHQIQVDHGITMNSGNGRSNNA